MARDVISLIAHLQIIDLAKIIKQDELELSRLIDICAKDGFFYRWRDGFLINRLDEYNGIVEDWFKKLITEKSRTIIISDAHGYKYIGQ